MIKYVDKPLTLGEQIIICLNDEKWCSSVSIQSHLGITYEQMRYWLKKMKNKIEVKQVSGHNYLRRKEE